MIMSQLESQIGPYSTSATTKPGVSLWKGEEPVRTRTTFMTQSTRTLRQEIILMKEEIKIVSSVHNTCSHNVTQGVLNLPVSKVQHKAVINYGTWNERWYTE